MVNLPRQGRGGVGVPVEYIAKHVDAEFGRIEARVPAPIRRAPPPLLIRARTRARAGARQGWGRLSRNRSSNIQGNASKPFARAGQAGRPRLAYSPETVQLAPQKVGILARIGRVPVVLADHRKEAVQLLEASNLAEVPAEGGGDQAASKFDYQRSRKSTNLEQAGAGAVKPAGWLSLQN